MRWRGGSAHTANGAAEWLKDLVGRIRAAGVEDITVRLERSLLRAEDGADAGAPGRVVPTQGSAPPLAVQALGLLAVFGQGRSGSFRASTCGRRQANSGARGSSRSRPPSPTGVLRLSTPGSEFRDAPRSALRAETFDEEVGAGGSPAIQVRYSRFRGTVQ